MERTKINDRNPIEAFSEVVQGAGFCCAGAKAALAGANIDFFVACDLRCGADDMGIIEAIRAFHTRNFKNYSSVAVLFPNTPDLSEIEFENFLWARLQALHDIDRQSFSWDPSVSYDPASPEFAFSINGQAYYVVGMHPAASRISRRMPFPVLAFNTHAQFRRLRADGNFWRVQKTTRAREIALQGYTNPMLAEHGVASEARQYSGREITEHWQCPFQPAAQKAAAA
jgi:hypothetical protein